MQLWVKKKKRKEKWILSHLEHRLNLRMNHNFLQNQNKITIQCYNYMNTKLNEPLTAVEIIGTSALHSGTGGVRSGNNLDRVCSPPPLQGVPQSPVDGKHNTKTGAPILRILHLIYMYYSVSEL